MKKPAQKVAPVVQNTTTKGQKARRPVRTNSHCLDCKRELRKNEGEVCDECRMTKLGWKRV